MKIKKEAFLCEKKIAIFMTMVMTLMVCFSTCPISSNAESTPDIVKTQTCTVNGIKRTLLVYHDTRVFLQIENKTPFLITSINLDSEFDNIGFDNIGTIWEVDYDDNIINWWNYDLSPDYYMFETIPNSSSNNGVSYVNDAKYLIFDDQGFVTGYKDLSDETHPILTLEEMKKILNISDDNTTQTPTPSSPAPTPNNSNTSPSPTTNPTVTPSNTDTTNVTPTPVVTKKSVKKKAGYSCLSVGSKVTSKYKLTNGKLTWKGNGKSKKFSGVKSAGFIKKSGNLVFMTKQGKVYTLSSKGKKKCIIKKKAKKLIVKNKFVVKVKVGKNFINLANK